MTTFTDIISATQCFELLQDASTDLRPLVLDCRANLGDPEWGLSVYQAGHVPGALHADLEQDLSDPSAAAKARHGRHPLPSREAWQATLRRWGLQPAQQVVAYDDAGGAFAARAWWLLRWAGHAQVAVLDGGLQQWQHFCTSQSVDAMAEGSEVMPQPSTYDLQAPMTALVSAAEVLAIAQQPQEAATPTLVDARTTERWAGKAEPIDPVAGHIPGAVCLPFQDNLDAQGCFKSAAELRTRFAPVTAQPDCICYCGSGVTAAHNILALHIAGYPNARLYADSWSGWITDPNRPVASA